MGIPFIGDLIGGVKDLVSEVIVDKDKRAELNVRLQELEDRANERYHEELMAQSAVNQAEAQHRSVFVAGWRPFIGWTGGAGVAWTFVISPLIEWLSRINGWTGSMPELDTSQLMTLVMAMLGVGAMRSYDKKNGTSNDVLKIAPSTPVPIKPVVYQPSPDSIPDKTPWE